jgi:hypothetical protein
VAGIAAPFAGRVVAIMGETTANVAGANLTLKVGINGTAGTLTATLAIGVAKGTATQTTGDTFAQGDLLGVRYTTPAGFTTNDIAAQLVVVPT